MKRGWRFRDVSFRYGAKDDFFGPTWRGTATPKAPGQDTAPTGQPSGQGATAEKFNDFNAGQGGEGGQGIKIAMRERASESHANATADAGEAPHERDAVLSHGHHFYPDHPPHLDHTKNETGFSGQGAPPMLDHPDHMPAGAGVCPGCSEVRWLRAGPTTTVCEDCEAGRLLRSGGRAGDMRHADDEAEITLRGEASR